MALGPIELPAVRFPDERLSARIAPALRELVEDGLTRVVETLFVRKAAVGVTLVTIDDLDPADLVQFGWRSR